MHLRKTDIITEENKMGAIFSQNACSAVFYCLKNKYINKQINLQFHLLNYFFNFKSRLINNQASKCAVYKLNYKTALITLFFLCSMIINISAACVDLVITLARKTHVN